MELQPESTIIHSTDSGKKSNVRGRLRGRLVNDGGINGATVRAVLFQRFGQPDGWSRHVRNDRSARLAFIQGQRTTDAWDHKINLQPLLVAEVVQLWRKTSVDLRFHDFRCNETFKDGSGERRFPEVPLGADSEQMADKTGIGEIEFRLLYQSFANVFVIRRDEKGDSGRFEDVEPLCHSRDGNAKRCRKIGLVEHLAVSCRQNAKKTPECREVANGKNVAHVTFEIRLNV